MTLHTFLQGFFADRFFGSVALASMVLVGWLAWMSYKEHRSKRLHRQRYLRRVERYFHA